MASVLREATQITNNRRGRFRMSHFTVIDILSITAIAPEFLRYFT